MVAGVYALGAAATRRLRGDAAEPIDRAAGFVLATALVAAVVHALALAGLATVGTLRPIGWALALGGALAFARLVARGPGLLAGLGTALGDGSWGTRVGLGLALVTGAALAAAALGPPTDADSLDYHLGVPLDWLRHGGAYARPDWLHARLVGLGEALSLLGLAAGTDALGAAFQAAGLAVAVVAVGTFARTPADRGLGALLVVGAPVMAFLVPNQKPQLLPMAATTAGLIIVTRRFTTLDRGSALLAFGCVAFAMACKYPFLVTGGMVLLTGLAAAARSRRLGSTLAAGVGTVLVLALPVYARNLAFYGDPFSPMLEGWRSAPDPAVLAFAAHLREYGGELSWGRALRLPWDLAVTLDPGKLSTVLGVGVLSALAAPWRHRGAWRLLWPAALAAACLVPLTQPAPRYFLEPYLWVAAAVVDAPWGWRKTLLAGLVAAQGVLAVGMALVAAGTLLPGAFTWGARDLVMTTTADGYAEAKWLDGILPASAVVLAENRSHALLPRPFVVPDRVEVKLPAPVRVPRVAALLAERRVTTLVAAHPLHGSRLAPLAPCAGRPIGGPARFPIATRNPFNRGRTYEVVAAPLDPDSSACQAALR